MFVVKYFLWQKNLQIICFEHLFIIFVPKILKMPRPKRIRKMTTPPHFKGYSPIGISDKQSPVILNFEEYEAIRLSDYELNSQADAAKIMEVSRPTFTRIYESARRKVALAFFMGKPIIFEGGKVYFDSQWYLCKKCGCYFNNIDNKALKCCALCGSLNIEQYIEKQNTHKYTCWCKNCGFEKTQTQIIDCKTEICPKCNLVMERKGF